MGSELLLTPHFYQKLIYPMLKSTLLFLFPIALFAQTTIECVGPDDYYSECLDCDHEGYPRAFRHGVVVSDGLQPVYRSFPLDELSFNDQFMRIVDSRKRVSAIQLSDTPHGTIEEMYNIVFGCIDQAEAFMIDTFYIESGVIYLNEESVDLPSGSGGGVVTFMNDTLFFDDEYLVDLGVYENTDNQQLFINGSELSLTNGGSVTIPQDGFEPNTDDQQISIVDNEILLEDGGSITIPQSQITYSNSDSNSVLVEGDIVNSGNGVILEYYFNSLPLFTSGAGSGSGSDDQNLSDFILDDQGTLSITIEDGNTVTADLSSLDVEVDPQTLGIIGSVISISDGNSITLPADQFEPNTDGQQLSFDDATDELTLESGGTVNLSKYNNSNGECMKLVVNASTVISPVDLSDDAAGRSIYINGIRASEQTTLNRIQHVSINPTTNEVTFYESLDNDVVAFCRN